MASAGEYIQRKSNREGRRPILVGESMPIAALRKSIDKVVKIADTSNIMAPVLITGETGSGKELAARLIHEQSRRAERPYVAVNCAALPEGLFQAEVFGVEKGAFTNAHRTNAGRIEAADGGTLLLDEIGDLSLEMQVCLLRFLEEGNFERLGSTRPIHADVCIIAATHVNLEDACKQEKFREDLFYRLNALRVRVPPLRDLGRDIVAIAEHFMTELSGQLGLRSHTLHPDAVECLLAHSWPGNVRELRNRILQALTIAEGTELTPDILGLGQSDCKKDDAPGHKKSRSLQECRKAAEQRAIARALTWTNGNVEAAAERLGISRAQLYRLINDHGIPH